MSSIPQRIEQETTVATAAPATPVVLTKNSLLGDYFQLFKVRVTSLVVMTAWAGYYMGAAKSGVSSLTWTLLNALVGIGVTCAGSAALNEVLEHKIDALMRRTRNRPLPADNECSCGRARIQHRSDISGVLYAAKAYLADLNLCRRFSRRNATSSRLDGCARQGGN
jgi:hypothetical protein